MVKEKLRKIISGIIKKPFLKERVTESSILTDDLGFDSLMFMELVAAIEKEFKISVEPSELNLNNFKNIDTIKVLLTAKIKG